MAFAQQAALKTQETQIIVTSTGWTKMESSTANPGYNQSGTQTTTVLGSRFAVKVFVLGAAKDRVILSYNNIVGVKRGSHVLGGGQFVVEPAHNGLTLYARAKPASGNNTVRVMVTEYGF